jgi:hypothetical protein
MSINDMYVNNVNIYICVHVSLFQYTYVFEIMYIDVFTVNMYISVCACMFIYIHLLCFFLYTCVYG